MTIHDQCEERNITAANLREEYLELGENMRHYANLQFAQLTVLGAFNAGLITLLYSFTTTFSSAMHIVVKIGGIVLSLLFLVMNERVVAHWRSYWKRAMEIEKVLGYKQYTNRPAPGKVSQTNAVRILHLVLIAFWVISVFFCPP